MLGAFSITSAIYADDEHTTNHAKSNGKRNGVAQFLNDAVGTGKTLQAFVLITGLTQIGNSLRNAHELCNSPSNEESAAREQATIPLIVLRDRNFF
jgi:hypothetical protein